MTQTGKPKSINDAISLINAASVATEKRADALYSGVTNQQTRSLYIEEMARREVLVLVAQLLEGNRALFNTLLD